MVDEDSEIWRAGIDAEMKPKECSSDDANNQRNLTNSRVTNQYDGINNIVVNTTMESEDSEDSEESSNFKTPKHPYRPPIPYEATVWTIFLTFTILAIVDRFTTNVWPRQTFSIGSGTAGSDRLVGFKPGPWSVKAYDCIARISGRFAICCFNLLLVIRLRFLEHYLSTSWVGKYVLDCTDIVNANLRLHRWNGIALCTVTVLHVWSILFPCVVHGYSAQVKPGYFEWPLSERTPPGFKDANPETKTMSLQADDVWRIVEMTLMLGVFMPLSVRWLSSRFHIGMPLHQFIMVLYFVDIVRRHSHPHSWVLNTPFFVLWLGDKVWQAFWRRSLSPEVHRIKLGGGYMALFWNSPNSKSFKSVGPDYSLRMNKSSLLEERHVFTAFHNHLALNLDKNFNWSAGTVVKVFNKRRMPPMGKKDLYSHTKRMYDASALSVTVWGPSHSEMSDHIKNALYGDKAVFLVASGSGVGYTLDALQYAAEYVPHCILTVLFTTRSESLYAWVKQFITQILSSYDHWHRNCKVVLALTGQDTGVEDSCSVDLEQHYQTGKTQVRTMKGRIDFLSEIEMLSVVFCQGGSSLKATVAKACRHNKAKFFGGRGGS